MKYFFVVLFVFLFVSCAETVDNRGAESGTLGGKCFTNNTCNEGLVCENDKCVNDNCSTIECDEWLKCSQTTGKCDKLKEGFCSDSNDCDATLNETCNEHKCSVENTEVEKCTLGGHECSNNTVKTVCDETTLNCVEPTEDLCATADCSADLNSECNPLTGNCECKTGFHMEENNNECLLNQKDLNCKKPDVDNSEYVLVVVTINWNEASNSWDEIPECEWSCNVDFYKHDNTCLACLCDEWETCGVDGSCTLKAGKCDDENQCDAEKICDLNHNCVNANNPCDGVECGGNGDCVNNAGTAFCDCNEHYYDDGSLNCVNPCDGKTCSGHGDCISTTILNAHCVCDSNYFEDGFNCVSPCTGHWDCNNSGAVDDRDRQGVTTFGTIDDPRGTCTASDIDTAECTCISGYEDPDNNLICTSVCSGVTCGGHGSCSVNNDGEASCTCASGYALTAVDSLTCVDIDECISDLDNCSTYATCRNTSGSFTCTCNAGYEGDGVTCTAVDSCNNSCDSWETCDNSICKPVVGRCNNDLDCAQNDCLIRNDNYTPVDPYIDPDCTCNEGTHYCEAQAQCDPLCHAGEECVNGECRPY